MTRVALSFPAGRYHATPWGRHVNEGAPEWPPSPWRLLRALVAGWKIRSHKLNETDVRPVLEALAAPPAFLLPRASLGHTRHYMPIGYSKGVEKTTKVFDAFVSVERERDLIVQWPDAMLDAAQCKILAELLDRLNYLGRAESWCEARLLNPKEEDFAANCRPLGDEPWPQPGKELVRMLCPAPETAFSDEHVRSKKGRPMYEPAWNLAIETAQLHKEKRSDPPPGSRWLTYVRRADCFHPQPSHKKRRPAKPKMHVARFALDSRVLPLATATLPIAERARAALMKRMPKDGEHSRPSRIFSGKDADGKPLVGHGHAYFLPTDEDGDGRLDHLTVFAQDGFGDDELRAIDHLRVLRPWGDEPEIRLLLLGIAQEDQFRVPPLGPARNWVSVTPFIATRHPKKSGTRRDPPELLQNPAKFIEAVLREELERLHERRGIPVPEIEPLLDDADVFRTEPCYWKDGATGPPRRAIEFKRFRSRKAPDDGGRRRTGFFKLRFLEPVPGPIALGHSSHFGMGLFLPAADQ